MGNILDSIIIPAHAHTQPYVCLCLGLNTLLIVIIAECGSSVHIVSAIKAKSGRIAELSFHSRLSITAAAEAEHVRDYSLGTCTSTTIHSCGWSICLSFLTAMSCVSVSVSLSWVDKTSVTRDNGDGLG